MKINLIINDTCQLECGHCNLSGVVTEENYLTFKEWERAYDTLLSLSSHIHLAGKEPLINDRFLQFLTDRRFTYSVVTNGLTLNKFDRFLGNFTDIVISYDLFHNIGLTLPDGHNYSSSIVVDIYNVARVYTLIRELEESGIYSHYISPIIPTRSPDILNSHQVSALYKGIKKRLISGEIKSNIILDIKGPYFSEKFYWVSPMEHFEHGSLYLDRELVCRAGLQEITITPDGEVLPCYFQFTEDYKSHSVGNILKTPLDLILHNAQSYGLNNRKNAEKCKRENRCLDCTQKCPQWIIPCLSGKIQ